MKFRLVLLSVFLCTSFAVAQSSNLSEWQTILGQKDCRQADCDRARALCVAYVGSANHSEQVEAQKCLANVALCNREITLLEGNDNKGGVIRQGYPPDAIDEALQHLNKGIELAPQDLSIHQGRLHILEEGGRYSEMAKALDQSCAFYKGKDALQAWLAYSAELFDMRQFKADLELTKIIEKHYPDNADVVANIGALYSVLYRDKEALPYLERAVQLSPDDPINVWNLALEYDDLNEIKKAVDLFPKAISLAGNPGQKREMNCRYAQFIEKKLKDRPRACTLEKENCEKEKQSACAPAAPPAAK